MRDRVHLECQACDGCGWIANRAVGMVDTTDCPQCGGTGESFDLECPACEQRIPAVLFCRHDVDPICVGCCEKRHDNPCPDCMGHGQIAIWGTGRSATCAYCEGSGRVNEGKP